MEDFLFRAKPWAITLVLHNWPVMVTTPLIIWVAVRTYLWPSRRLLEVLYGLLLLTIAFEYQKHGLRVARRTTSYLFSPEANPDMRWFSQLVFLDVLPLVLPLAGIVLILLTLLPGRYPPGREQSKSRK